MTEHKKMAEYIEQSFQCNECEKTVKYKAQEGFTGRFMVDTQFIINLSILVDTSSGKEIASYLKRHAQFCSLKCTVKYCHNLKEEDFDVDRRRINDH